MNIFIIIFFIIKQIFPEYSHTLSHAKPHSREAFGAWALGNGVSFIAN